MAGGLEHTACQSAVPPPSSGPQQAPTKNSVSAVWLQMKHSHWELGIRATITAEAGRALEEQQGEQREIPG